MTIPLSFDNQGQAHLFPQVEGGAVPTTLTTIKTTTTQNLSPTIMTIPLSFDNQVQAHLFPQVEGGAVATLEQAQHCRSARPKTSRRSERREMKL